jgi:hypothetical protein
MRVTLKTTAEQEFDGVCPSCHEHTTAGDSCCGRGAVVDGDLVSDESAQDTIDNPSVCIQLLKDAPEEIARAVHSALFKAGVSSMMFSGTRDGTEYGEPFEYQGKTHTPGWPKYKGWNVNIFVSLDKLPGLKSEEEAA